MRCPSGGATGAPRSPWRSEPFSDAARDLVAAERLDTVHDVAPGLAEGTTHEVERPVAHRAVECTNLTEHPGDRVVALRGGNDRRDVRFLIGRQTAHRTFAPGGRSRSTVSTASLPSTEPARTMPFDSIPMSLA